MTSKTSDKREPQAAEASSIELFHLPDETIEAIMRYLPRQGLASMTLVSRRLYPIATSLNHEHIAFFDYKLAKKLVEAHGLRDEVPRSKVLAQCTSNLALHEKMDLSTEDSKKDIELRTFLDIIRACNGGHVQKLMMGFNPVYPLSRHASYVKAVKKSNISPLKLVLLRCKYEVVVLFIEEVGKTLQELNLRDVLEHTAPTSSVPFARLLQNLISMELSSDNLFPQRGISTLLKEVAPQLKSLKLAGPYFPFREDVYSPAVLSTCTFGNLRHLECLAIPLNTYKAAIASAHRLEHLDLTHFRNIDSSVLSSVPTTVHTLKYEGLSMEYDPPRSIYDNIVKLSNLKRLPVLKYESVPHEEADPGARQALSAIRAKLLAHFDKMGIPSMEEERLEFLPYKTYGQENVEDDEVVVEEVAQGTKRLSLKHRVKKKIPKLGKKA